MNFEEMPDDANLTPVAEMESPSSDPMLEDFVGKLSLVSEERPINLYKPDPPHLINTCARGSSITITWRPDYFSQGYVVMRRKDDDPDWHDLISLSRGCSMYTDFDVIPDVTYHYTVKSFGYDRHRQRVWSDYDQTGLDASIALNTVLDTPELIGIKVQKNGLLLKWYKVDGAQEYQILRKDNDAENWSIIGSVSGDQYYFLDEHAESNHNYVYSVQAVTHILRSEKLASAYNLKGLHAIRLEDNK